MNEREKEIVIAALSYMASNVDDVNDAIESTVEYTEKEVFELIEKLGKN